MIEVLHLIGAILILLGVSLTAIAALGLFTFRELYARMHAASKPQLLGLTIICLGISLSRLEWRWVALCTVVIAIQTLAAPVASHLLARSAYRTNSVDLDALVRDDLRGQTPGSPGSE